MADTRIAPGEVWLVGAGPGDPELLTRKAEALIGAASMIFHDALVSPAVLALAPADARCIPVGKRSGRHSKTQEEINRLLVSAALAGERVVRLKGGDPSVFGRSAEELAALAAADIPARICPGITAASAAAASVAISLTLRGAVRRLQFVTAHARAGEALALDWKALADPAATLAVYMGRGAAAEIAARLTENGLASDTPVLVAANVSLPDALLLRTRLDLLPLAVKSIDPDACILLLIGSAVAGSCPVEAARRTSVPRRARIGDAEATVRNDDRG